MQICDAEPLLLVFTYAYLLMDPLERAYCTTSLKYALRSKRGAEFQDFFGTIMELRHPHGDFIRVRPWGTHGDRKNDGYLRSTRNLFQVYAPNDMKAAETMSKVEEDFAGALEHWEEWISVWTFVHNSFEGLSPDVTALLTRLGQVHSSEFLVDAWGPTDLLGEALQLAPQDLELLIGPIPGRRTVLLIGFEPIRTVLLHVARRASPPAAVVRPVSQGKLEANGLSDNVAELLKAGMSRADDVRDLLERWPDPKFGEEIANAFKGKYAELKATGLESDVIFDELQIFCGGTERGTVDHQAAVLVVLAYLFETCDIFEPAMPE